MFIFIVIIIMEQSDFNENQLIEINDDKNNNKFQNIKNNNNNNNKNNFFQNFFSSSSKKTSSSTINQVPLNEQETNETQISNENKNENKTKEKTCKDKLEEKIINSIEIERNYTIFFTLLFFSILLICISFLLLPMIVTSPSKFTLCFSLGSFLFLLSFLFFHGTKNYFQKLFKKDRFTITILFLLSIFLGCFASIKKYYIICIICSIFEFFSLILFMFSFVPGGGKCGLKCLKNIFTSPLKGLFIRKISNELNQ